MKTPPPARAAPARLRLRVTAAAETILRGGHPWLFADSIREQNRPGECGELAVIYDRNDSFLAVGLFDPDSPIRVRILHAGKPQTIDRKWWRTRLEQALNRRRGLFDERTNGFRCINGESDGWPGLVLDRYDSVLVLKLYSAAWLPRIDELVELLTAPTDKTNPLFSATSSIILRLSRNIQTVAETNFKRVDGWTIHGARPPGPVTFLESGITFAADVVRGQKTGFFLDQRENRRWVETVAKGRAVLNAFSFSGGFSLYAARGGAVSVTDVDISAHALDASRRNFELNAACEGIARCPHQLVKADAFDWLAALPGPAYDLVILDPPSMARRETERATAVNAYGKLAGQGIRALNPGGVLLAASCSAHVTADEFFDAVRQAATASGRTFNELQTTAHAPDHHATFPEAEYLKAVFMKFD